LKIEYRHTYQQPRETVWDYLQNEQILAKALPGCKRFTATGDGKYDAELGLDLGPIKGAFEGQVEISDVNVPESYRLRLHGRGMPGELTADSQVELCEKDGKTEVTCVADAQATGLLASVGQRVMGSIARMMLGKFFKAVEAQMREAALET